MSDLTSSSDEEPGTSTKCKKITNKFYGNLNAQQFYAGVGDSNADAGNI